MRPITLYPLSYFHETLPACRGHWVGVSRARMTTVIDLVQKLSPIVSQNWKHGGFRQPIYFADPDGRGPCFPKSSVHLCRHNDIHYRSLPEIDFTASGFFLKNFDRLCVFVFVSFWSFLFCESTHYEKQKKNKKKKHKNNNNLYDLQTGLTNTLLCRSFSEYHEKRAYSLCVIKKSTSKCTICTKQKNHA